MQDPRGSNRAEGAPPWRLGQARPAAAARATGPAPPADGRASSSCGPMEAKRCESAMLAHSLVCQTHRRVSLHAMKHGTNST
eukprot:3257402-Lingulodinium_polyedra.AAC.1